MKPYAKGLIQRTIELQCYAGDPKYDIAEVTDSTGAEEFQELSDELNEIRNSLLIARLVTLSRENTRCQTKHKT